MIQFECQSCGRSMDSPVSLSGKMVECPGCHRLQAVPPAGRDQGDIGEADRTLLAGTPYRAPSEGDATRAPAAGYQSLLLSARPPSAPTAGDGGDRAPSGVVAGAAPERYRVGDRISDRYEVLAVYKGSMGVVYATYDHELGLPRALKTLQERFSADWSMRRLFEEEAVVWVRLEKHPFIVRAYLVDHVDGQPYVITEYIRGKDGMGGDLRAWLGHSMLTLPVAAEMALQIAQGMQHATRKIRGLAHGDLKPANILVNEHGRAMITDFGLARAARAAAGTPAYMAPELWQGENTSVRSDIYAYGCILYEMFTAHRLYAAGSIEEWKQSHLSRLPAAPRAVCPELPADIEDLVRRCLDKNALARPAGWDEIVDQCAQVFHHLTGQPVVRNFSALDLTTDELAAASYSLGELGRYVPMLDVCERFLRLAPESPAAWANKACALYGLGRCQEAVDACEQALALNPRNASGWSNMGVFLKKLGRFNDALAAFERSLEIEETAAQSWLNKGLLLAEMGKLQEALNALDRCLALGLEDAEAWHCRGQVLAALGQLEGAIDACERALMLNRNHEASWRMKGDMLMKLGRVVDALAAYSHAPPSRSSPAQAESATTASALADEGRLEDALATCDRSLARDENDVTAWKDRGRILQRLERWEEALDACGRWASLDPMELQAWDDKATILRRLRRPAEAVEALDHVLGLDQTRASTWADKGSLLHEIGRLGEAETALGRAIQLAPHNAKTWCERGDVLLGLGRLDEARKAYTIAWGIVPTDWDALKGREKVDAMLKGRGDVTGSPDAPASPSGPPDGEHR